MGTYSLNARLQILLDAHKLTQQFIYRLFKLSKPNNSNNDTNSASYNNNYTYNEEVRQELVSDIHESLKQQEEDLELLRQEIDESFEFGGSAVAGAPGASRRRNSERERDRARVAALAARLGEDLRHAKALFRNAQLSAKRAAEAAKQRERDLLSASLLQPPPPDNTTNTPTSTTSQTLFAPRRGPDRKPSSSSSNPDALLADTSSDVVAALRRTHALLATELTRSRFAQETLDQSGRALAELTTRYSGVNDLLGASRQLVGELLRSQKSDSWYLQTALYILVGTLGWLVFRRFLWGPLWLLVWFPVKTGVGVLVWTLGLVGIGSGGKAGAGAGSSVSTVLGASTSLVVKPSATGRPPARDNADGTRQGQFVRVGMGGQGAKRDGEGKLEGGDESLVDRVGEMVEEGEASGEGQQGASQGDASREGQKGKGEKREPGTTYRADGQPLVDSDAPRNRMKRMMEEPPARKKDEL